jgi:eukaryotic-like serine/threonine-protein kinase
VAHPMLGPYRLQKQIGSGGMASVFEATHEQLDKRVALKLLHPHVAEEPKAVARFLREGRAAARIRHPHAVSVLDAGMAPDGTPYLVMELERGETLASWVRTFGALGVEQAVDLMLPVLSAIQHAHALGIVHRDLKPANILIGSDHLGAPVPKIADFGISRSSAGAEEHLLTADRGLLGTLAYMAPEQIQAPHEAGAAADQYSAGVVLYQCLTGRLPFEADSAIELARLILHAPVPPLHVYVPNIPTSLEASVRRAMERNAHDRFSTIGEFARELLPFASEHVSLVCSRDFTEAGIASRLRASIPPGGTMDDPASNEWRDLDGPKRDSSRTKRYLRSSITVLAAGSTLAVIVTVMRGRAAPRDQPASLSSTRLPESPAVETQLPLPWPPIGR